MQIVSPLIVLFIAARAWRAWRRSPAYSLQTTLQLAGAFLVLAGTIVALTMAILSHPTSYPAAPKAVLLTLGILAVLAGFIAVVFRILEGRLPQLPQGASPCDVHRRRLLPWIRRTGALLAMLSLAALLVPSNWMALPLVLAGLLLLAGMSILYPLYLRARRFDRGMTALLAEPWIHWHYAPEQWQSWAAIQRSWERARTPVFSLKRDWSKLLLPLLLAACTSWLFRDGGTGETIGVLLASTILLLLSAAMVTWAVRCEPERRYRRMLTARREAYMGADGLYCSGEYSPWIVTGSSLTEATAVHGPPTRLVLTFDSFSGDGTAHVARMIPIPEGCEGDLAVLQLQLQARCPKASVHLIVTP